MSQPESFRGHFLIAPPNALDKRFSNTVIYVVNHTDVGAWGVVTNKPFLNLTVNKVLDKLGFDFEIGGIIHAGGPVNTQNIHIIHTPETSSTETQHVSDGISVSSDYGFLSTLAMGPLPENHRMFLGAVSWAPGQLEGEMRGDHPWKPEHSWLYAPADPEVLFELDGIDQWKAAVELSAKAAVRDWMC